MAITYKNIAGEEPSTVTFRVATVQIARGSTNEYQEILTLGDPESSIALGRVVATPPASTEYGLVVRPIQRPAASFTHGQVGMSTTATQIVAANANRARLLLINHSTVSVYLGPSTVASTSGLLLNGVAGNQILFRSDDAVFGITAASTGTVSFMEETI